MRLYSQQETNIREERPWGAYLTAGGPSFVLSASAFYYIDPRLQVEVGAGAIGYFSGIKFHLSRLKIQSTSVYTGAYYSRLRMKGVGSTMGIYAPLGWQHISEFGLAIGVEVAVWHGFQETSFLWGGSKWAGIFIDTRASIRNMFCQNKAVE